MFKLVIDDSYPLLTGTNIKLTIYKNFCSYAMRYKRKSLAWQG